MSNDETGSGDNLTDRRVRCAVAALKAAGMERGEYPLYSEESVASLLCDLRGFCLDENMDFERCSELGLLRFTDEREGDK